MITSRRLAAAFADARSRPAAMLACLSLVAVLPLGGCGDGVSAQSPTPPARLAEAAPPAGSFRITVQQATNLHIAPAELHHFRTELVTEGRIALDGDHLTQVFSPYSGRVVRVLVSPGDRVRAGMPLLEIEASEFAQAQNDLLAAAVTAHSAASQLELARSSEQRRHALYDARGGSLQDWQQSQNEVVSAEGNLHTAESALGLVRNRLRILGKTPAEIEALESGGRIDPRTFIAAPIGGVVTERQVGPGQFVQAGASTPMFSIGDLSRVWLVGNVRESQSGALHLHQAVEVRVPAVPGRVFQARLSYIAPAVDPATHRLAVRAEMANPDGMLRPEMFAEFTISTGGEGQVLAVPEESVVYDGEQARLWVETTPNILVSRAIRTGRSMHGLVEVLEGLRQGEQVVTSGTLFIDRAGSGQ